MGDVPAMTQASHNPPIQIRTPRSDDYPRLAELAGQLGYRSTKDDIARRIADLDATSAYAIFLAEQHTQAAEIVGWICIVIHRTLESDPFAEITGFIVDERHRSEKVGEQLLARAENWAQEQGINAVRLRSNVTRNRAHAFYLRHGYEHHKTQKAFRKILK